MYISKLTGILSNEVDNTYVIKGERFIETSLSVRGFKIPITCSEYLLENLKGKVTVEGFFKCKYTYVTKKRKLFTYFFVKDSRQADESLPERTDIEVEVTITKIDDFTVSECNGLSYLPIIGVYKIGKNSSTVIHSIAIESVARRLRRIKVGDTLHYKGYVASRGPSIQIVISEVVSINGEEETTNEKN